VFAEYQSIIRDYIKGKNGVYALYKGHMLYYVGLTSNMRTRIKHHLKDRHAGKWDSFSFYLTEDNKHIKELETLILKVAEPKGNKVKGNLPGSKDLFRQLDKDIKVFQNEKRKRILKGHFTSPKTGKPNFSPTEKGQPSLAPYVSQSFPIQKTYKGKTYKAKVRSNGKIYYEGVVYDNPTAPAKKIVKRTVSGWLFWHFKNDEGKWIKLHKLREKKPWGKKKKTSRKAKNPLAPYVTKRFPIRGIYKGKTYKASVRSDGTIQYDGKIYNSPSGSARAARKQQTNGWTFWKCKNRKGIWVNLETVKH